MKTDVLTVYGEGPNSDFQFRSIPGKLQEKMNKWHAEHPDATDIRISQTLHITQDPGGIACLLVTITYA